MATLSFEALKPEKSVLGRYAVQHPKAQKLKEWGDIELRLPQKGWQSRALFRRSTTASAYQITHAARENSRRRRNGHSSAMFGNPAMEIAVELSGFLGHSVDEIFRSVVRILKDFCRLT
jgi:hypothetical protein